MSDPTEAVLDFEEYARLKNSGQDSLRVRFRNHLDPFLYISSRLKWHFAAFVIILSVSTVLFQIIEKWSFMDSLYFSVVTLFTVGYGDLVPSTEIGRLVAVGLILGGISTFTFILQTLISQVIILRDDPELRYIWRARKYHDHVIILGFGNVGEELYSILRTLKIRNIVIMDNDNERVAQARELGATVLHGDALDPMFLAKAGVFRANTIFLTLNTDQTTIFTLLTIQALHEKLNIFVHIKEEQTLEICDALGLTHVVWERFATIQSMYESIFHVRRESIQLLSIDENDKYGLTIVHSPFEDSMFRENYMQGKFLMLGIVRETGSFKPFGKKVPAKEVAGRDVLVVGSTNDLQLLSGSTIEEEKLKKYKKVLILGLTHEIRYVLKQLVDTSEQVVVVEWDEDRLRSCQNDQGYEVINLHYTQIHELGDEYLSQVDLVLLDGLPDPDLLYFGIIFRRINRDSTMIAKVSKRGNEELFYKAGYSRVLQPEKASASELIRYFTQDVEKSLIFTNGVIRIEKAERDMVLKDMAKDTKLLAIVEQDNLLSSQSLIRRGSQMLVFTIRQLHNARF